MTSHPPRLWPLSHVAGTLAALALLWLSWRAPLFNWVDIDVYTAGGRAVLGETPLYAVSVHGLPFTYPPFAGVVFVPLALLATPAARVVLTVLSVAAYLGAGAVVARRLGLGLSRSLPVLLLGLTLEPLRFTLQLGQINTLLLLAVVLDCLVVRRGRGWLVGLAAGIKITPGVFVLYFALKRDWAAVRRSAFGFLASVAVGALVLPHESWSFWSGGFAALSKWGDTILVNVVNQSAYAAAMRLAGTVDLPRASSLVLGALAVSLGLWVAKRSLAGGDEVTALVAVSVGGLLASPVSWSHHWVWMLPGLLVLLARGRPASFAVLAGVFALAPMILDQPEPLRMLEVQMSPLHRVISVAYTLAGILWLLVAAAPVTDLAPWRRGVTALVQYRARLSATGPAHETPTSPPGLLASISGDPAPSGAVRGPARSPAGLLRTGEIPLGPTGRDPSFRSAGANQSLSSGQETSEEVLHVR